MHGVGVHHVWPWRRFLVGGTVDAVREPHARAFEDARADRRRPQRRAQQPARRGLCHADGVTAAEELAHQGVRTRLE